MKKHWSLLYVFDRVKYWIYTKKNPKSPWFAPDSVDLIGKVLKKTDLVLEFGSGRSTFWFAERCKQVISVENSKFWFEKIENKINKNKISNIEIYLKSIKDEIGIDNDYVNFINNYPDSFFDVILIDGKSRAICTRNSLKKLRNGGVLIIDDVHRYIPTPNLNLIYKDLEENDLELEWRIVYSEIKKWRFLIYHNKFMSTGIFFK
jgi:SAM-dependent methyltransferase